MRKILTILLLLIAVSVSAQSDFIINTVTFCIAAGKYNDAEKFLDSILKIEPKNIDALMMKGNVLLNYSLMQTPAQNLITLDDESIYSPDLAALKTPTILVPREQALKIEKIWKECVQIDTGRLDIREGLCTVYGMADMKKELIDYLPVVANAGKEKGNDFVYALIQYAHLLADRGDIEGSYEAYKKIGALYPGISSVWCQLASAYRSNGDLVNAKLFADKAFASPPDMSACGDALDLYAILGEYTKVLPVLKTVSHDSAFPIYSFYDGIYSYAHHDTTWRKKMTAYLQQFTTAPDSDVLYNAARYMLAPEFKDDYHDFVQLLSFANSDFYTGLVVDKAMKDYKDSIQPWMEEAKLMVDGHNYAKANTVYAALENKKMSEELKTVNNLEYGFSLYCAHDYAKAIIRFKKISDPVFAPLANYFLGQCSLKSGNKNNAIAYFKLVMDNKGQTKYGYLASLQMDKMVDKLVKKQ